jgi:hypothetical protein
MQYVLSEHELRRFATEVAGRSSVPFMREHPSTVMPSEELVEGVDEILNDWFGIEPIDQIAQGMNTVERDSSSTKG